MRLFSHRLPARARATVERLWRRMRTPTLKVLAALLLALMVYGIWPYVALWNLHLAVMHDDHAALAAMVDVDAVRDEIAHRLNKECDTVIGELSDAFIAWLETGIRQDGKDALETQVTLGWVQDQLIAATAPGLGFLSALSYGFFDSPGGFMVRMERGDGTPVTLRLRLTGAQWRVTAVYY